MGGSVWCVVMWHDQQEQYKWYFMDVELLLVFMLRVFIDHKNTHGDAQFKTKLTHNHDVYNIKISIKMIKINLWIDLLSAPI